MKKVIAVLIVIVVLLCLAIAGALGYLWYRDNHIFVDDAVYAIDSESIDLRGQDISFEHYESVRSQLPDCEIYWDVPFQNAKYPNDTQTLAVSTLTQEDIDLMKRYFPALKKVDASACGDYVMLEALMEQMPEMEVIYQVDLGGKSFQPDSEKLELENGDYDFDVMLENLRYLRKLTAVTLHKPDLTQEQIARLEEAYEAVSFTCTVEILGTEYDVTTTELNLSAMTSEGVAEAAEKLSMLPNLTNVELMAADGTSQLSKTDVRQLMDAAPDVVFNYQFDFYGITLSTADEEVHIDGAKSKIKIGDEGIDEVRAALDIMTNCKRFVLESCNISNEVLAKLRDEYRDRTKIVWRVWFGKGSTLTDVEALCAVYNLSNDNCKNLMYCEDIRFMDLGHNGDDGNYLRDISYIAYMPKLEACILSSAYISDLTPFASCKNLQFLEIAYCGLVPSIEPLAECKNLKMLNMSFTGATDLSPLDDLPITHLCAMNYSKGRVPYEEQQRFQELHPECWSQYVGEQPYGPGWRYTEDGDDFLDYYAMLRVILQYDKYPHNPNHTGWYLRDAITESALEPYSDTVKAMCNALLTEEGE